MEGVTRGGIVHNLDVSLGKSAFNAFTEAAIYSPTAPDSNFGIFAKNSSFDLSNIFIQNIYGTKKK